MHCEHQLLKTHCEHQLLKTHCEHRLLKMHRVDGSALRSKPCLSILTLSQAFDLTTMWGCSLAAKSVGPARR